MFRFLLSYLGTATAVRHNRFSSLCLGYNGDRAFAKRRKSLQSVRPAADLEKHRSVDAGYYRLARAQRQFICWQIS